jgi:hypothetical protein
LFSDSDSYYYSCGVENVVYERSKLSATHASLFAGVYGESVSSTFASNGDGGFATSALLNNPYSMTKDKNDNTYISDTNSNKIRKVTVSGIISTFAGDGHFSFDSDQASLATNASLARPTGLWINSESTKLYFSDTFNHRIRSINLQSGIISTVAGTGLGAPLGNGGFSGDGGLAVEAQLKQPTGICGDSVGNIYVADSYNNRIRFIDIEFGTIVTFAGNGIASYSNQIAATSASLNHPSGVWVDTNNDLFIADAGNQVVSKVSNGLLFTIAGMQGQIGYVGDGGYGLSGKFNNPVNIVGDTSNNLYISDFGNKCIRKLTSACIASTLANASSSARKLRWVDGSSASMRILLNLDVVPKNSLNGKRKSLRSKLTI